MIGSRDPSWRVIGIAGELLDTVLDRIRTCARVSICGAISQYDDLKDVRGPKRLTLPEHVEHGIERFPDALIMLFTGGHMGKLLVAP